MPGGRADDDTPIRIAWRKPGEGGIMGTSLGYPVNSSLALWLPEQCSRSDVRYLQSQPAGPSHPCPTAWPRPRCSSPHSRVGGPAHPCLRVTRGCHLLSHGRRQRPGALSPSHSPVARPALTHFPSLLPSQPEPRINAATQQSGCQPPSLPPRPSRERLEKGVKGS